MFKRPLSVALCMAAAAFGYVVSKADAQTVEAVSAPAAAGSNMGGTGGGAGGTVHGGGGGSRIR